MRGRRLRHRPGRSDDERDLPGPVTPEFRKRPCIAADRIGFGKRQVFHSFHGCGVRCGAADVPPLTWWIRTNDQEIGAGFDSTVPGSGGQDGDISGPDGNLAAVLSAKHNAGMTLCEPEHLMCSRMIVVKIVDTIAPLGRPPVVPEHLFET